jgi:hypothetical protein
MPSRVDAHARKLHPTFQCSRIQTATPETILLRLAGPAYAPFRHSELGASCRVALFFQPAAQCSDQVAHSSSGTLTEAEQLYRAVIGQVIWAALFEAISFYRIPGGSWMTR